MEQVLFGIILIILGIASLLDVVGLVEIVSWWGYVSPVLVVLVGIFMILRAQGRMAARSAEKRANKQMTKAKESLEKELEKKEKTVQEQGEVIDDLVNPKIPPQT